MAAEQSESQIIASLGLRAWEGSVRTMRTMHRHDDLELNLLVEGTCVYTIDGEMVALPRGRLMVLWAAVGHRSQVGKRPGCSTEPRMLWTTVALRDALAWPLDRGFVSELLERGWAIDRTRYETDEAMIRRWVSDLSEDEGSEKKEGERREMVVRLEMEARLHRLAASRERAEASEKKKKRMVPAEFAASPAERIAAKVEALIAARFQEALSVDDIADAIDRHPNYAMGLFKKQTGQTFVQAITRRRVTYAQQRLALSSDAVLAIGLDAGFGSTSRFYEAFTKAVGCSPAVYRRHVRG